MLTALGRAVVTMAIGRHRTGFQPPVRGIRPRVGPTAGLTHGRKSHSTAGCLWGVGLGFEQRQGAPRGSVAIIDSENDYDNIHKWP